MTTRGRSGKPAASEAALSTLDGSGRPVEAAASPQMAVDPDEEALTEQGRSL